MREIKGKKSFLILGAEPSNLQSHRERQEKVTALRAT
jgi:hypothetical protein